MGLLVIISYLLAALLTLAIGVLLFLYQRYRTWKNQFPGPKSTFIRGNFDEAYLKPVKETRQVEKMLESRSVLCPSHQPLFPHSTPYLFPLGISMVPCIS